MNLLLIFILCFILLFYLLPRLFIGLRFFIFTHINREKGIQIPNKTWGPEYFKTLYAHPHVRGKSEGAELSDLFWYFLSPGAHMHQEHLEEGDDYEKLAAYSKSKLNLPKQAVERLLEKCIRNGRLLNKKKEGHVVRIRDELMPIFAKFFYELIFNESCSKHAQKLIVAHANDVISTMKCCKLRDMATRAKLTHFLYKKIQKEPLADFPPSFSLEDQVYFLQSTFFATGVIQMSDAMSHLLMVLAKNPSLQEKIRHPNTHREIDHAFINETFRLFPLFGIAHRIVLDDVIIDDKTIKKGTVICFNYDKYHKTNFQNPYRFQTDRWKTCPMKTAHYAPFGIKENRMCPAQGIALIIMRVMLKSLLKEYYFFSSARQTRALPNRGPMLIIRKKGVQPSSLNIHYQLIIMKIKDIWETTTLSFLQLIYGCIILFEARKLKLVTKKNTH